MAGGRGSTLTAAVPTAEDNLRLAYHLANRFRRWADDRGVDHDDLYQVAALGLVRAVQSHDPGRRGFVRHAAAVVTAQVRAFLRRQPRPSSELPELADPGGPPGLARLEVEGLLRRLPARQRKAVELHFGLGGGRPLGLAEVGAALGVSQRRAGQLVAAALGKMRRAAAR
jgi:DNA-directed RNA polymerase specialized sigma subunit